MNLQPTSFCIVVREIHCLQNYKLSARSRYRLRVQNKLQQGTNSMQQSPSWIADSSSAIQQNFPILCNQVSNNSPLVPVQRKIDPVHTVPYDFCKTHFNIIPHLHLDLPCSLFPSGFPAKMLSAFLFYPISACLILDLITQIIPGKVYRCNACRTCNEISPSL